MTEYTVKELVYKHEKAFMPEKTSGQGIALVAVNTPGQGQGAVGIHHHYRK